MVRKRFIDKKNSTTYRLVHRSQRDPLINDENAPKLVLQEISSGKYLNEDDQDSLLEQLSDDDDDNDNEETNLNKVDWKNDVSNFGVYFKNQDEYDYLQHMKPFGQDPNAVVVTNDVQPKKGIQFKEQQNNELFGSKDELETGLLNQQGVTGLNLDLDPEIRNAFVALDDEAYVEDLDDDFFDAFHVEQVPDKYKLLQVELLSDNDLNDDDDEIEPWMKEFKKFQNQTDYKVSDEEFSDEQSQSITFPRTRKKSFSNFSMSSSALFRNDKLTLLDDQFDKIMEQYSDEEIGAINSDDDELKGTFESSETNGHLDEIFDSFLENLHVIGKKSRLVTRKPEESLDAIRSELKEQAKDVLEKYEYVIPITEMPIIMPGLKKKNDWDVETVLTTNSNIYNRPQLIKEISRGAPKIRIKRGIPVVLNKENTESESALGSGSGFESDDCDYDYDRGKIFKLT